MSKKDRYNITIAPDLRYYVEKLINTIGLSKFVEDSIRRHTGIIEAESLKQQIENIEAHQIELAKQKEEIKLKIEDNKKLESDQVIINDLIDELKLLNKTFQYEKNTSRRGYSRTKRGIELNTQIIEIRKKLNTFGVDLALVLSD